jgi:hypothetical protein
MRREKMLEEKDSNKTEIKRPRNESKKGEKL